MDEIMHQICHHFSLTNLKRKRTSLEEGTKLFHEIQTISTWQHEKFNSRLLRIFFHKRIIRFMEPQHGSDVSIATCLLLWRMKIWWKILLKCFIVLGDGKASFSSCSEESLIGKCGSKTSLLPSHPKPVNSLIYCVQIGFCYWKFDKTNSILSENSSTN